MRFANSYLRISRNFARSFWQHVGSHSLSTPIDFQLEDLDAAIEGELILVAQGDDRLLGFISWWPPEDFIHNLFVRPECVRQKIGTALLQQCLARIGRPARLKCSQQNHAALGFYQKQGWQVESEGSGPDGTYYLMVKQ